MGTAKKLTVGILAHVDAGKTTLTEAMLYQSGKLRRQGRVDHGDTYLDSNPMERERGITIFSKQARLSVGETELILLDTPGHTDFCAETERTLQVLDYAILTVSATDGVQSHTQTLWKLLEAYRVPTVLFVNKTDLPNDGEESLANALQEGLCRQIVPFYGDDGEMARAERIAMISEDLMEEYFADGGLSNASVATAIAERRLFPCFFGAALRTRGIDALLRALDELTLSRDFGAEFGARVYKIMREDRPSNARITCMRLTGGVLRVRDEISYLGEDGTNRREKVAQIRLYSGERFEQVEEARAGEICAVTGLSATYAGEGIGAEPNGEKPLLEPVLTYRLALPDDVDPRVFYPRIKQLEEEDPALHFVWQEAAREICVHLMGEVQTEVLRRMILDRFGVDVAVDAGSILYKETVEAPVEGIGHYEPLRHYAEVHLLIEPTAPNSGVSFDSKCPRNALDRNWQRLILTHLGEKLHRGVLTGAPLTDVRITLLAGRAHLAHTEGGDFREATYRAVRQGLMQAKSVLLEPFYAYRLEIPAAEVGRAMTDLERRHATASLDFNDGKTARLSGTAPVSELRDYPTEVRAYTHGTGTLSLRFSGYAPCHNAEAVIGAAGYDPLADEENPSYSVFCKKGAGFAVPWDHVREYMHVDSGYEEGQTGEEVLPSIRTVAKAYELGEEELEKILLRVLGPVRRKQYREPREMTESGKKTPRPKAPKPKKQILVVDGYNVLFSWRSLAPLARQSIEHARERLIETLENYVGYTKFEVTVVFDGYRVRGNAGEELLRNGVRVIYTAQDETADARMERLLHELGPSYDVRAVTSDALIQISALHSGVLRMTSLEFEAEVERIRREISEFLTAR